MKKEQVKESLLYLEKVAYVLVSLGPLGSQKNNVCYVNLDLFKQSLNNFINLL